VKTGLALPSLLNVTTSIASAVVGIPLVYLLSRALRLRPKPIEITNPREKAILAFLIIITAFVCVSVWRILTEAVFSPTFGKLQVFVNCRVVDVLWMGFLYVLILPPLILLMKRTRQPLRSIGIDRMNIGRMLALGFILSAIFFAILGFLAPSFGGGFEGFSPSLIYGLIYFTIVGFGEEIVWRGYVQTRLVAYGGTFRGLVVTSLLFAVLWHFPGRYYMYSGAVLEALASSLLVFPSGLVFGYLMMGSQNIIPSSILHLFGDWNYLFWQIPIS